MSSKEKLKIVDKIWNNDLNFKDKVKLFLSTPDKEHFRLGLYIRNKYLYTDKNLKNKDIDFDELSNEILILLYKEKFKRNF